MHGGKAIEAGSYGCVFRPPLKCKHKSRPKKGVSKLLLKKHADKEMAETRTIYKLIKRYPRMKSYILIPNEDNPCQPDTLTATDLIDFDKKCNNFLKLNMQSNTINKYIKDLGMLQLEYGGEELVTYINQFPWKKHHVEVVHKGLTDIMEHVINPMNQNGLYHSDIKNNNIMIHKERLKLIDFGLTFQHDPTTIHSSYLNKYIDILIPYSVILFNDSIPYKWSEFYNKNKTLSKVKFIHAATKHIISVYKQVNPSPSDREIELLNYTNFIFGYQENSLELLANHLAICYYNYKNPITGEFEALNYYNEEFVPLIDIWGILVIYLESVDHLTRSTSCQQYCNSIKHLLKKHMFSIHKGRIDSSHFLKDLKELLHRKHHPMVHGQHHSSSRKTNRKTKKIMKHRNLVPKTKKRRYIK